MMAPFMQCTIRHNNQNMNMQGKKRYYICIYVFRNHFFTSTIVYAAINFGRYLDKLAVNLPFLKSRTIT